MRSPLEHEPELIAGVGLITARWAALESELSDLLGSLLKIEPVGGRAYYAIANFSQRVDLLETMLLGSITPKGKAPAVVRALFERIRRIWKVRNHLIHSHYVYAQFDRDGDFLGSLSGEGRTLGEHPKKKGKIRGKLSQAGVEIPQPKVHCHGFAYVSYNLDGSTKHVLVNKGTFNNHADQVSKRLRQVRRLTKAVKTMEAPLRWGSFTGTSYVKSSPRAVREQQEHQALLARRKVHTGARAETVVKSVSQASTS